ncbi:MAG TPA: 50S ribosomal protein L35 [Ruminiclostridium sp.]|nr:50S ribosomal protein L35 [Ruminiclostridium sp.]
MPKLKTHSSSKKRFKLTATGKIKRGQAWRSHRLVSKSKKAKKHHRLGAYVSAAQEATIKKLIPYK